MNMQARRFNMDRHKKDDFDLDEFLKEYADMDDEEEDESESTEDINDEVGFDDETEDEVDFDEDAEDEADFAEDEADFDEDAEDEDDFDEDVEEEPDLDEEAEEEDMDENMEEEAEVAENEENVSLPINQADVMTPLATTQQLSQEKFLHDVALTLKCEVGTIQLSIQELLDLHLGSVLNISSLPPQVKLTLNGKYIATGALVEVDGMLGVKLTSK